MHRFFAFAAGVISMQLAVIAPTPAQAAETDVLAGVLKKIDGIICSSPKKITQHYTKDMVIMSDDHRTPIQERIDDYERMIAGYQQIKCAVDRKVLGGHVADKMGYMLADETINIKSGSGTNDERQHSFCTYVFKVDDGQWKISLEHCSSLPDYHLQPGDDALYYFHNPVY